jgi:chorismate synthase
VLRFLTAGESHGKALVVIVEGLPAGLPVTVDEVQAGWDSAVVPGCGSRPMT